MNKHQQRRACRRLIAGLRRQLAAIDARNAARPDQRPADSEPVRVLLHLARRSLTALEADDRAAIAAAAQTMLRYARRMRHFRTSS
jgi:hypothetical protein